MTQPRDHQSMPFSARLRDTGGFEDWLEAEGVSVLLCLGGQNRLLAIGRRAGELDSTSTLLDQPRAVSVAGRDFVVATRYQLWTFVDALVDRDGFRRCDRLMVARHARTIGEIGVEDMTGGGEAQLLLASSLYSCLGTATDGGHFEVQWTPPFATALAAEERSHVSGIAVTAEHRIATLYGRSDVPQGWRSEARSGGMLFDMGSDQAIATGLEMPRAPRIQGDAALFLQVGRGTLNRVALGGVSGEAEVKELTALPGVTRAMQPWGSQYALVATSRFNPDTHGDYSIAERIDLQDSRSGLWLVDTTSGDLIAGLELEGVEDIDGLAILADCTLPYLAGLDNREMRSTVTIRHEGRLLRHHVQSPDSAVDPIEGPEVEAMDSADPADFDQRAVARDRARSASSRLSDHLNPDVGEIVGQVEKERARVWKAPAAQFVEQCKGMLYPPLQLQVRSRRAEGDLLGVALVDGNQMPVALAVGSLDEKRSRSEVLSFWVRPDLRRHGLGTRLLEATVTAQREAGVQQTGMLLRADWHDCSVMERLVQRCGFSVPEARQIAFRNDLEYFIRGTDELPKMFALPEGYQIVRWSDLTPDQLSSVRRRQEQAVAQNGRGWYPVALDPFQLEEIERGPSRAMVKEGRVVGWMLTHGLAEDTLQYTALFIDPELRQGHLAGELIKDVVLRHREVYLESRRWRFATFLTDARNAAIRQLIDIYFRPFNPEVTELRWTSRALI